MSTFNKHGEIDDRDAEAQRLLAQKEVGQVDVPEKQVQRPYPQYGRVQQRTLPPVVVMILSAVVVMLLVGAGVGLSLVMFPNGDGTSAAPTNDPIGAVISERETPTTVQISPEPGKPTLTSVTVIQVATAASDNSTPTLSADAQQALNYTDGIEAYERQDWSDAATLFESVYDVDDEYLDVAEKLSATYYNWGVNLLSDTTAALALDKFNASLTISPTHQLALAQQERLVLYIDAIDARQAEDWREAAVTLEELREIQADFLDSTAMLYDTYLQYGAELEAEENLTDALRIYRKAVQVPVDDVSDAEQKVSALVAIIEPTPTRVPPQPARLRFTVLNYNDTPTCISINVSGVSTSGWYFTVDGIRGVSGRFDGSGNARACGLGYSQEVTISVRYANGSVVAGGSGIPSRGGAIMAAPWR
jgi:tetratricopeptide (TPR) repeat protein